MTFFLDLWHDLRDKRLWPVAVGLLAAAVAIPVIMLKPAGAPTAPPVVASNSDQAETLPAVNVDIAPTHGSKLETFSTRNPFKPLSDLQKEDTPAAETTGSTGSDSGSGDSTGGSSSSGGSSLGGGSSAPSGDSSGGTSPTTPTTPSNGGGGLKWYRYSVDVKFGTPDAFKTLKAVPRLGALPDENTPAVVFMGVTDDGAHAVFYVSDGSLTADGEGACSDEKNCKIVTLGLDGGSDEETFTSSDGSVEYDLQLLKIHRESMDAPQGAAKQAEPTSDAPSAKKIGIAHEDFLPLLLVAPDVALAGE